MKSILLLLTFLSTAFAANDASEIPGFAYIRDAKEFIPEDSKLLTSDERRVLNVLRAVLAFRYKTEIKGQFAIAEAAWGFQVKFSSLKAKQEGTWMELPIGVGEVFMSKRLDRIQIDYGP